MDVKKEYHIKLTEKDYRDLLEVLSYTAGLVSSNEHEFHQYIMSQAKDLRTSLTAED